MLPKIFGIRVDFFFFLDEVSLGKKRDSRNGTLGGGSKILDKIYSTGLAPEGRHTPLNEDNLEASVILPQTRDVLGKLKETSKHGLRAGCTGLWAWLTLFPFIESSRCSCKVD